MGEKFVLNVENNGNDLGHVVESVFGKWENLERKIEEYLNAYENDKKMPKPGSVGSVRILMEGYANKVDSNYFKKCIQAVNIVIGRINKKNTRKSDFQTYTEKEMKEEIERFERMRDMEGAYAHEKQMDVDKKD